MAEAEAQAFTPVTVTALVYHTVNHEAEHAAGETYAVDTPDLLETLVALGFAGVNPPPPPE